MIGLLLKVNSFAVSGEVHRLWNFCVDCRALFRSQPPGWHARSAGQRRAGTGRSWLGEDSRRTWALATIAKEREGYSFGGGQDKMREKEDKWH
jgi:hypothetical protein